MSDNQTPMDEYDAYIGRNIRALREARGLTQTELASMLTDGGLPFRQQTLVKIESGSRPLRLREAHAISDALGADLGALVARGDGMAATEALVAKSTLFKERWDELREAANRAVQARWELSKALDAAGQNEDVLDWVLNEGQTMLQVDLVEVVADEVRQREEALRVAGTLVTRYRRPSRG